MRKVLFTATVLKNHILKFHLPYLKWFKENGYEVWVIANNDTGEEDFKVPYCDHYLDVPFTRSPLSVGNLKTYKILKKIIKEEKFDLIHTHTPAGSVITRMANKGCKLIYTAHGFHFYKGASLLNWLVFYPIEKIFSKKTDVLITINKEDYQLAKEKFYMKQLYYIPGVGLDFSSRKRSNINIRDEYNIKDYFLLISIGELNKNKNHRVILEAIKDLADIHYIIAGEGKLKEEYLKYIKDNNMSDRVHLLGFRNDIFDLLNQADLFVFPSIREGLPVSIMEAMYCSLPCVVSNIRGNVDLIENDINGYLCNNVDEFKEKILFLYNNPEKRKEISGRNKMDSEKYTIDNIKKEYLKIYERILK